MSNQKKIRFIFDEKGNKTDIIIPIDEYEDLLEDLNDLKVIKKRKNEKLISIKDVKKIFKIK